MKQTSVEWYFTELWTAPKDKFIWHSILIKAKEMEKQQIMNSFADGFVEGVETQKSGEQLLFPQQYYNETYGKDA
jgi:hypothetical protein